MVSGSAATVLAVGAVSVPIVLEIALMVDRPLEWVTCAATCGERPKSWTG